MESLTKKICIIGAGPRGLVAARHFSESENTSVTVFEAQEDIGGVWLYKETNILDPKFESEKKDNNFYDAYKCFPNSMYPDLITNLPYYFMEFKDLGMKDLDKGISGFIDIPQYKKYLDAYAEKFNLRKQIHLNTLVSSVRLSKNRDDNENNIFNTSRKFVVKTIPSKGDSFESYHDFDYIIVATGQYFIPYYPQFKGSEKFKGHIMHCKDFRHPNSELFQKKKVLVLGGSFSAFDMLVQLLYGEVNKYGGCEKVILSSRKASRLNESRDFKKYLENGKLSLHPGTIAELKENTICFTDGTEEEVDTILLATGYKYKFPYFDLEKDKIIDHDENSHRGAFFGPVYKRIVAIREPSVFFVGFFGMTTLVHVVPELQSLIIRYIIEGKIKLPSEEEMMKSFNQNVEDHLQHVGDLAHFYKTNLSSSFPGLKNNNEVYEWRELSDWLRPYYKYNNEAKSEKYFEVMVNSVKVLAEYFAKADYISFRERDYLEIYPEEMRNTTEFV